MKKKYAVLYSKTNNIGDDIQTLAAINFLKSKNITEFTYVSQCEMSEYDGDEIYLIMNGWFMHDLSTFPPSEKIIPIFISFHVAKPQLVTDNLEYFKKHEPIGCRDESTVTLFEHNNIKGYFTGCLTTTFNKSDKIKSSKKYLFDINNDLAPGLMNGNINLSDFEGFEEMTCHCAKINHTVEERMAAGRKMLDLYATADIIITSRLHVALPCRSLGTNCVFIHAQFDADKRFKGLDDILNGSSKYHHKYKAKKGSLEKIQKFFEEYKFRLI